MKRTLLFLSALTVFAALLGAQDDAAYEASMKAINAANRPMQAAIRGNDVAAASAEATKIAAAFDSVLAYWKAKNVEDAIALSTTARDAAKTIADAKDSQAQAAANTTLRGTCNKCHMAHRGGQAPDFEIK